MSHKYLINGNFLNRNLTGIERFSFEVCKRLDELLNLSENDDISILISKNARIIPTYKNIKIVKSDKEIHGFPMWDLLEFKKQCKKNNATGINFSNTAPLGKNCGLAFLHDIYAVDCPEDFSTFKDKLVKAYSCLNYRNIAKNSKLLFTVSDFSKQQIIKKYKIYSEKIHIISNGWDHFNTITEDDSIFTKFPTLKKGDYYFTLGSLSKRKNLKWIADYAEKHPEELFAVSGKAISGLVSEDLQKLKTLKNVVLVGYVTDENVKSLMKNCKAFILPSYYEGFGIPPLEALSTGTKIIVAKASCLPEIYGNTAHYIDPNSTEIDLTTLLSEPTEAPDNLLKKYTYENAAKKLYEILKTL